MHTSVQPSLASALIETLRVLKRSFCDTYRPELHYMRGPGPKWRERHELRLVPVPVRRRPSHFLGAD
jgi:hypothetical protein